MQEYQSKTREKTLLKPTCLDKAAPKGAAPEKIILRLDKSYLSTAKRTKRKKEKKFLQVEQILHTWMASKDNKDRRDDE